MNYNVLKTRQRENRDQYPSALGLRVHRALSWLRRAELCDADEDARFIFLWIAFNAAYANEIRGMPGFTEKKIFGNFLRRLVEMDDGQSLYQLVWSEFPRSIRLLLDNRFVFQPFWDYHNGNIPEPEWQSRFRRSRQSALKALGARDTARVLGCIFSRLYTLRNQLIHGGSSWNSTVNREQVRDGADLLGKLVPVIIGIMMAHTEAVWGDPCYPVVD